jgi:4'-phosphopantetheinyl transferase
MKQQWEPDPIAPHLKSSVDLWIIDLNQESADHDQETLLSADEKSRAARFVFPQHHLAYSRARCALRCIIARYLHCEPNTIRFIYNPYGKPLLTERDTISPFFFNLSHSGSNALLVVSDIADVGTDIEQYRKDFATKEFARSTFSHQEYSALKTLDNREFASAFFRCWTRKESLIKAMGEGLSYSIKNFDVALDDVGSSLLMNIRDDQYTIDDWKIIQPLQVPGYSTAVTIRDTLNPITIQHYLYNHALPHKMVLTD